MIVFKVDQSNPSSH